MNNFDYIGGFGLFVIVGVGLIVAAFVGFALVGIVRSIYSLVLHICYNSLKPEDQLPFYEKHKRFLTP